MSFDPGPLMSPYDFRKTENLLAEFVRRMQAGIPMAKRLAPPVSQMIKAVENSTVRRQAEFAQINANLSALKEDVDRQAAARAERERELLVKAIAQTESLLEANPGRKPSAYLAEIRRQFDAMVATLGSKP